MRLVFDRGTLLLLDAPASPELADLPGTLWDPRVRALRAPARMHAAICAALAAKGVAFADHAVRPADPTGPWTLPALRPYQDAALWAWEQAGRRGLVVLPTGSGKTRLAVAAMARAAVPTLVLVPTRVLLAQWIEAIAPALAGAVGCLGDGERSVRPVTVATFESAWRHMHELGDRYALLVVDEVHHFGAGVRDEALELCTAHARLGLTATPPTRAGGERLGELMGPTVYARSVAELSGRYLAPFDHVTLLLDLEPGEREAWLRAASVYQPLLRSFLRDHPGADWRAFAVAAARTDTGRSALAAFRESRRLLAFPAAKRRAVGALLARHADARVLVFTADNAAAYEVARAHLVMPITCDIARTERAAALARFREGALRVLVSARVLNEGIDVPDAEVAIVVGGTQGEREHVQRVGRLLRPREGKTATVYELVMRNTHEVVHARRRRAGLAPRQPALL